MIGRASSGFLLMVLVGVASADDNIEKDGPALRPADLRCADGSTVRVVVLDTGLDVETRYGRLTVPVADVRRIEFGLRLPDELTAKVRQALDLLDSDNLQDREAAGRQLVDFGRNAYPSLLQLAAGASGEKAKRIDNLVKTIRQRVPAADLTTRSEDQIHTSSFTVVGRMTAPSIRVRTALFGTADLRHADLYALQFRDASPATPLRVEAAKYAAAGNVWMDTGITVEAGDRLAITASGQVGCTGDGFKGTTGPAGKKEWAPKDSPFPAGALLGRIGTSGTPFLIGERYEVVATRKTKFYIRIAPFRGLQENADGFYDVRIVGGRTEGVDATKP